jgi:hypothetical protein
MFTFKTISGKLLIVIKDHTDNLPDICVFVQSVNGPGEFAEMALMEDARNHLVMDVSQVLSKRQMLLPEGTTFRLSVTCVINYHMDYYGEWDSDFWVMRCDTLKEQLPTRKTLKRHKLFAKRHKLDV